MDIDQKNKVADRLELIAKMIRIGALRVDEMETEHHANHEHLDGEVTAEPNGKHTITLKVFRCLT